MKSIEKLSPGGYAIRVHIEYDYLKAGDLTWVIGIIKKAANEVKREHSEKERLSLVIEQSFTGNSLTIIGTIVSGLKYASGVYAAYKLTTDVLDRIKRKSGAGDYVRNKRPNIKKIDFSLYERNTKFLEGKISEEHVGLFELIIRKEQK